MAEPNLIKTDDMAKARELDFVLQFESSWKTLQDILGVTRPIVKEAGATLRAFKATGTLESGVVPEGDTIPLSHYKVEAVNLGEVELKKWRKSTSAEAILAGGYEQAVTKTTNKMLKDVQNAIKGSFFTFLKTGTGTATGTNLQTALANIWGELQVKFEDTSIETVYFINPKDMAGYLGEAQITMQTAFGMNYIENFLGLGTVILSSEVEAGKVYATAKENIVTYFVDMAGAGIGNAFQFTTDESGLIGIHEKADYTNMTCENTVASGVHLFAERIDGVVVGTIGATRSAAAGKGAKTKEPEENTTEETEKKK